MCLARNSTLLLYAWTLGVEGIFSTKHSQSPILTVEGQLSMRCGNVAMRILFDDSVVEWTKRVASVLSGDAVF